MITPAVRRAPNGHLLPGASLNPGGRPRTAIETARAQLMPQLPLFLERLAELTQSSNETIRLQALREIFDRLLGRSAVFVDTTHTRVDVGAMYLAALKRANSHGALDDNSNAGAPAIQQK